MKKISVGLLIIIISLLCSVICFAETSGSFTYTVSDGMITITDFDDSITGDIVIPSKIKGYPVTKIGSEAFNYCKMTSLTIPSTVTDIEAAFSYRANRLENFIVDEDNPSYATSNGILFTKDFSTLVACPIAKSGSYEIPKSVKVIGEYAFSNCQNLTEVTIPFGVEELKTHAFAGCAGLTKVVVPNSVTMMGSYAFDYCTKLTDITLSENIKKIESNSFNTCTSLKEIVIPDSVESIGWCSFAYCENLETISISKNISKFDTDVFYDCDSLKKLIFKGKVTGNFDLPKDTIIYYYEGKAFLGSTWNGRKTVMIPTIPFIIKEVSANSETSIEVVVTNNSALDIKSTVVCAIYEGNRLVEIKSSLNCFPANDDIATTITFDEKLQPNKHQFKFFVWESLKSMTPVSECVTGDVVIALK